MTIDEAAQGSYCLVCYAEMERSRRASERCEQCGSIRLKRAGRVYWTREPTLRDLQYLLQAVVSAGLFFWVVYLFRDLAFGRAGMHAYHGSGVAAAAPILVGVVLWDTASLLTRRRTLFRMDILWPALVFTLGAAPALALAGFEWLIARQYQMVKVSNLLAWMFAWGLIALGMRVVFQKLGQLRAGYLLRKRTERVAITNSPSPASR